MRQAGGISQAPQAPCRLANLRNFPVPGIEAVHSRWVPGSGGLELVHSAPEGGSLLRKVIGIHT